MNNSELRTASRQRNSAIKFWWVNNKTTNQCRNRWKQCSGDHNYLRVAKDGCRLQSYIAKLRWKTQMKKKSRMYGALKPMTKSRNIWSTINDLFSTENQRRTKPTCKAKMCLNTGNKNTTMQLESGNACSVVTFNTATMMLISCRCGLNTFSTGANGLKRN